MKAYREGYNACYMCKHIDTCPYVSGTIEHDQWRYGWMICKADCEED